MTMKTNTKIATLLVALSAAFSINANADSVYGDPSMGDVFPVENVQLQSAQPARYVADTGKQVWSTPYEQWVNPADFNSVAKQTVASALNRLDNNPPAAGSHSDGVFIWDETADEFQLQ